MSDTITNGGNFPHDLMAWDEWVLSHLPVVVQHAQVAVADTTKAYVNFNLIGFEISGIVLKRLEYSTIFLGCVCFDYHYLFSLDVLLDLSRLQVKRQRSQFDFTTLE